MKTSQKWSLISPSSSLLAWRDINFNVILTRSQIQREEWKTREHMRRIHEAFAKRSESDAAWKAWELACRDWHGSRNLCFYLWSREARARMHAGEREVIEDAILFLEVDPWFFRSGYLKERVLRHLKRAALTEDDRERLQSVIKTVMQARGRREFGDYCRMALQVWTPQWELEIRELAARTDARQRAKGKLLYLLHFLDKHRYQLPPR